MNNKQEDSLEYALKYMAELKKKKQTEELEEKRQLLESSGQRYRSWQEQMYVDTDHLNTIDNGVATLWYIIIMLVGAVFNDRLLIWIIATVIWWRHINRKKIRQKEWDKKHNGGNK